MQNRYTGDIGDFSKLGLLRALQAAGLSIGLVALCDGLLPVGAAHLRLLLRRLLLPEVFLGLRLFLRLCAMCTTCHVGLPFGHGRHKLIGL